MEETAAQIEARLIRDYLARATPAEYEAAQSAMLKEARATAIGKPVQGDTSNVRDLSEADYQKRQRDMLRHARQLRTR